MYGLKYQIGPYAYDSGLRERVLIERWDHSGSSTSLQGAGPDWLVIRHGRQGAYNLLEPLPTSEALIRVVGRFGSRLAEIQGTEDGAYRVRWQTEIGGTWRTRWVGYLAQQDYRDYPYEPAGAVEVRAVDGLGLLQHVLWDHAAGKAAPDALHRALEGVVEHLRRAGPPDSEEGLLGGLVTRMDWRPHLGAFRLPEGRDPLTLLLHRTAAFTAEDGSRVTALDHLRELAQRFGASLFQSRLPSESEPRWFLRQRHAWRPDSSGNVAAFGYAARSINTDPIGAGGSYDMGGGGISVPSLFEAGAEGTGARWLQREEDLQRGVAHRVRSAASTYGFEPQLSQLLANGSFEEAGATAETARGWTFTKRHNAGVWRWPLQRLLPDDFDDANAHGLVIELPSGQSAPFSRAEQETGIFLPGVVAEGAALRLSYTASYRRQPPSGPHVAAGLIGGVAISVEGPDRTWYAHWSEVRVRTDTRAGQSVTVYIDPIAADVLDAAEGTVAIPAGTTLDFRPAGTYRGSLTLRRAARVGDTELVGDLTHNLKKDDTAWWWPWTETPGAETRGTAPIDTTDTLPMTEYALALALSDLQGRPVAGHVRLAFVGGSGSPLPEWAIYDNAELSVEYGGSTASEVTYEAALASGTPGLAVGLGTHRLGDGPSPESDTALHVLNPADGSVHPTLDVARGPGWKAGAYASGEPSTGLSLDALHARAALRAQAEPLERRRIAMLMQEGAAYEPHMTVRLAQTQPLEAAASAGATTISTALRLRVGTAVTIGPDKREVTAVTGDGPFFATLDSPLTAPQPLGAPVRYTIDYAPDYVEQVPGRSLVVVEGTEVFEPDGLEIAETVVMRGEAGPGRGAGGGGGYYVGGGGGGTGPGGPVAWGDITGKPPLVNTFNGRSGVVQLVSADVTDALGYTPVPPTRQVASGTGLTGGGDLSANRTLELTGQALALHNLSQAGLVTRRTDGQIVAVGITSNFGVEVADGRGQSGNPHLTLTGQARRFHDLAAAGLVVRRTGGEIVARQIAGTANRITVTNAGGEGGNPTLSAPQDLHTSAAFRVGSLRVGTATTPPAGGINLTGPGGTPTFVPGWGGAGWRIEDRIAEGQGWTAEFDTVYVRGALNVYELIINRIRAVGGSFLFAESGKVREAKAVPLDPGRYDLTLEEDIAEFAVGDLILAQQFDPAGAPGDVVWQSRCRVESVSGNEVRVRLQGGSAPQVGYEYVRIGNDTDPGRQGAVYITSSDSGAPHMKVLDGIASWADWGSDAKVKAIVGRIKGSWAEFGALDTYGLLATDVYLKGRIIALADSRIAGWHVLSTSIHSGAGEVILDAANTRILVKAGGSSSITLGHHVSGSRSGLLLDANNHILREGHDNFFRVGGAAGMDYDSTRITYPLRFGSDAQFAGRLQAPIGLIGGLTLEASRLYKTSGGHTLELHGEESALTLRHQASGDTLARFGMGEPAPNPPVQVSNDLASRTFDNWIDSDTRYSSTVTLQQGPVDIEASRTLRVSADVTVNASNTGTMLPDGTYTTPLVGYVVLRVDWQAMIDGAWRTNTVDYMFAVPQRLDGGTKPAPVALTRVIEVPRVTWAGFSPARASRITQARLIGGNAPTRPDWLPPSIGWRPEYNLTITKLDIQAYRPAAYVAPGGVTVYSTPEQVAELGAGRARFSGDVEVGGVLALGESELSVIDGRLYWRDPGGNLVRLA